MKELMKLPGQMRVHAEYAHYTAEGVTTLAETVALVTEAIRYCHDRKVPRLLVDLTQLGGFPPPEVHDRYRFAHEWAQAARGKLILAVVAREEMLDRERFGILAAKNAGLRAYVSISVPESREWLLKQHAG